MLSIAPVEIKNRIQDNKNKNAQNNNKTSGAVWLRSMVFNGERLDKFAYLGKEGAEKKYLVRYVERDIGGAEQMEK